MTDNPAGDRDLSGFKRRAATVPPPPRATAQPARPRPAKTAPPADDPTTAADAAAGPARGRRPTSRVAPAVEAPPDTRRAKVMTSIPAALHHRLRHAADDAGTFKADIVLEALAHRGDAIRAERQESRLRRRRVADATQCQLYLTAAQRAELDGLAADVGLSRSDLVTRLLELHLPPPGQP